MNLSKYYASVDCTKSLLAVLVALFATAQVVVAQHTLPVHRAYTWNNLSLDDLKGELRVPVIFIDFTQANGDNEYTISDQNKDTWLEHLNDKVAQNHMGGNGSVNDYFLAQSYGQLNVTFEEVGTYTATGKASNYSDYTEDAKLVAKAVKSFTGVDWSRFDCNGDKEVDCVLCIFAGHADGDYTSRKSAVTSIYPHQNWLTNRSQQKADVGDGYKVQSYVFANNLRDSSSAIDAINTVCHELSHGIFDLPDYYKNMTSFMGQYDAMCYGMRQLGYGSSNNHCPDYSTFSRMYLGWLQPYELTTPGHVTLRPLSQHPEACVIFDPKDANHFFLLENRALINDSWDAHLPAGGLVVTEVHYSRQHFESHSVNSIASSRDVALICAGTGKPLAIANATYYNFDQTQVPFGIKGRTSIGSNVSKVFESQTVTNITVGAGNTIEFDFMGGGEDINLGINQTPITHNPTPTTYDLMGRVCEHPLRSGIYIVDGRKVVVR